jgi:orotidine-5'-phosphate decarboxylase
MNFREKFEAAAKASGSFLCCGLDLDPLKLPAGFSATVSGLKRFAFKVIDSTQDLVCAYKPNIAFYESLGLAGGKLLKEIIRHIPGRIPVILDAKRADIGNTSAHYAKAAFEEFCADAVTVNPYMGSDSVEPFLKYTEKCTFILVVTSNKGGQDFQFLDAGGEPLYIRVARKAAEWNTAGNIGAVVGATHPDGIRRVREILKKEIFLIPGIGTQAGDVEDSVKNTFLFNGTGIFNVSRDVLYAGGMKEIRSKAEYYRDLIAKAYAARGG